MALPLTVAPHKLFQSVRVGLRPNCPAAEAGVAVWPELCAVLQDDGEKTETFWAEYDIREILLTGPSDFPLHDFCPPTLEALGHMIRLSVIGRRIVANELPGTWRCVAVFHIAAHGQLQF